MEILVVTLFVLQLLSFCFIVILNMKLSKFKTLELKQERLMREMDDAVGGYLLEMHEENNRLIDELTKQEKSEKAMKNFYEDEPFVSKDDLSVNDSPLFKDKVQEDLTNVDIEMRTLIPKNVAAKAYTKQKNSTIQSSPIAPVKEVQQVVSLELEKPLTYEEQVVKLSREGQSAEQIAKTLQKGKTEIELLLKLFM